MKVAGSQVLLTGATGGIGHAIARAFAAEGARLLLTGRRADVLEPLAEEVGGRALAVDLAEADDVERLIGEAEGTDIVIANAALPASGHLHSFEAAHIQRALDVNLAAPIRLAHALTPAMVQRGQGHFVLISSMSGKTASVGSSIYSATKFGMRGFGLGLREDLRDTGVGVSVVFPGFISDAGMFADTGVELPGYVGTKTPDDVARAVVRAVERDLAEVDVAPLGVRAGAKFAGLAPELSAKVQRRLGAETVANGLAEAQKHNR